MMRYETERLSFSLLALCGDGLSQTRERLAENIRSLNNLATKHDNTNNPAWQPHRNPDIIHNPADPRLSKYQLEETDILSISQPDTKPHTETTDSPSDNSVEEATKFWAALCAEQKCLRSEYEKELQMSGQEDPDATLGRTKDYTAAIHEWVKKLADHGVLRRLHEEVQLQNLP